MTQNIDRGEVGGFDQRKTSVNGDVFNVSGNLIHSTSIPRNSVPDSVEVLPYLANRERQAEQLSDLTNTLLKENKQRIIICLIPGAAKEHHEGIMERYQKVILPKILPKYDSDSSTRKLYLEWPKKGYAIDASLSKLKNDLLEKISKKTQADGTDVFEQLSLEQSHVNLRYSISCEDWCKSEQSLVNHWIDYWLKCPQLKNNKLITIFLCLRYKNSEDENFLGKLFKCSKTSVMRRYVERSKQNKSANLIYLDELMPLSDENLRDWGYNICPSHDDSIDVGVLQTQIDELCSCKESKPLSDWLKEMREALKKAYYKN